MLNFRSSHIVNLLVYHLTLQVKFTQLIRLIPLLPKYKQDCFVMLTHTTSLVCLLLVLSNVHMSSVSCH